MTADISVPSILAVALRSPSYLVLKRTLMFIADLIAGSKSLRVEQYELAGWYRGLRDKAGRGV
jgi:hypothetical protein